MLYPAKFSQDMKELTAFYEWNDEDKKEIRAAFTDCPPMVHFFTVLAAAYRAGYRQTAANGFARLQSWCIESGVGDPFGREFDVAALDAIVVEPRNISA